MKRLVALIGAVVLVDTMFYAALTPLLPEYADELGLSKAGAGVLTAMYPIGLIVSGIPAGLAASWLGVKRTLLAGVGGTVVTTALFGFADSVWLLDVARFLQGAASSFSWTAGLAWLVADAPSDARGRVIGSAMGAAIFGAMLGPVIGGVASLTSTAATFGGIACLGVLLAVWAWTMPALHEPRRQPISFLFRAARNKRVLVSVWFIALPAAGFGILNVLGPLRLDALGLGALAIGSVWLVSAGCEAALSPVVGHVSDRRGRLVPLRIGLTAAAVTFAVLPVFDSRWWLFVPALVASTIALGTFWAPAMSMASDEAEATGLDYAFGFALVNLAWAPAIVAGAAGGGALAEATSDTVPYLAVSTLCALTLAALWRSTRSW
jgi:predicted MFS family arabinose efflux permease